MLDWFLRDAKCWVCRGKGYIMAFINRNDPGSARMRYPCTNANCPHRVDVR